MAKHTLDLENIISLHKAWNEKLELTLRGKNPEEYDPAIIGTDHVCTLGKWMYGEGQEFDAIEEFHLLKDVHVKFHACAGKILTEHKHGRFGEAIRILRHELPELSRQVQDALYALSRRIEEL